MLVLGIESSCDETALALVRDGKEICINLIASQEQIHRPYGGVVPELACRSHVEQLEPLFSELLSRGRVTPEEIDLIAVTQGPGLIGALLIGINFAKGLALTLQKPLIGVNHVEAHLYASFMQDPPPPLPALGLVLSGGHTLLVEIEALGCYRLLGQTQDDAIGEAFDKVARLLGLPYPGGPEIEKLAHLGDPLRYSFKSAILKERPLDFSFSGLKTAVLYTLNKLSHKSSSDLEMMQKADMAASFQRAAFLSVAERLCQVLDRGCNQESYKGSYQSLLLGGGVSQNRTLRLFLESRFPQLSIYWPPPGLSLDNAAMIAGLGFFLFQQQGPDSLDLPASPRLSRMGYKSF